MYPEEKKEEEGHVTIQGHRDSQGTRPCEDRGREMSGASTSQGTPRIANNHQKPGERHRRDSPSDLQKKTVLPTP